jgi:hypothetical protein
MREHNIDIIDEEHAMEGLSKELDLFQLSAGPI